MDAIELFEMFPSGVAVHEIGFFFLCAQCGHEWRNQFLFNLLYTPYDRQVSHYLLNDVPASVACACPGCGVRIGIVKCRQEDFPHEVA